VSVGGRVLISRAGLLTIVKLDLPQAAAGTTVTPTDMVQQSLLCRSFRCEGWCADWLLQELDGSDGNIAAGVPIDHADDVRTAVADGDPHRHNNAGDYKTFAEPVKEDTLLLTNADAVAEANRRLACGRCSARSSSTKECRG
jgi:hypothetical protein